MKRKYRKIFLIVSLFLTVFIFINSCKPAIGTAWYPKKAYGEKEKIYITEISINGNPVSPFLSEQPSDDTDKLNKFVESESYFVNVDPSVEEITLEDIKVKAVKSLAGMEDIEVDVKINGGGVPLSVGKPVPITLKIQDKEAKYEAVTKIIKVKQGEPAELELKELTVCGLDALSGSVTVPYKENIISAAKIQAKFAYGSETARILPIEIEGGIIELKENESKDIKILVKELKGQYKSFEFHLSITREEKQENEDEALEPNEIYVLGIKAEIGKEVKVPLNTEKISADDIVVIFNNFGDIPVKLDPEPAVFTGSDITKVKISVDAKQGAYQEWSTNLTIKKDAMAVYNPVDKKGNQKYIIKVNTITEEIDPFIYYNEDYEFPASKFDNWVLNMPSMSGIIASYRFIDGNWEGSPEQWTNEPGSIGSGLTAISNVKVYRYKTRADRWNGSYTPAPDPNDSRFYFYRFTATASAGVEPDNSMFCVDKNSKFLFYYSDPGYLKSVFGNKIPYDWTDYAAPTSGDHVQFSKPFYMSDPVGYVKEDGSVVMYSWIKDNINNSNYHAQENPSFTKPAEKKANGAGFSPYRNKIVTKKTEVVTTENPDYTLAQPVILAQPKALRLPLNSTEDAVMTVKTVPVTMGESLSYKWYTNAEQSNEGGTLILNADSPAYRPDKTAETNCYVYCEVTNTNSSNGLTDTVKTDAVKLLISSGSLYTDAAQPKIIKQPERNTIIPINTSGTITLTAEAVSIDMGQISYQWYQNTEDNNQTGQIMTGETSASITVTVPTSEVNKSYYYCVVTNTNDKLDGEKTAIRHSDVATIEVEESYQLYFSVENLLGGSLTAICDGKQIQTGAYVKKGQKVSLFAQADGNYEVLDWENVSFVSENKMFASMSVIDSNPAPILVRFRKIPNERTLTIIAKEVKNVDLVYSDSYPYAYYIYNFKVNISESPSNDNYESLWSIFGGNDMTIGFTQVSNAQKLNKGESVTSLNKKTMVYSYLPDNQYFRLNTKFVKYDNNFAQTAIHKQYLSDYNQSVIEFSYNRLRDEWTYKKADDIPQNFVIKHVEVTVPENFVLRRGETKDFTINYYVDNQSNHAVGNAQVTYTLKWE